MVEMDERELEINYRLGYKRDLSAINREWEINNTMAGDCQNPFSIENEVPKAKPASDRIFEDLTEVEAGYINHFRTVYHKKEPITTLWNA